MRLAGRGDDSDPLGLTDKNVLILQSDQAGRRIRGAATSAPRSLVVKRARVNPVAVSSGEGFLADSPVAFYLLPSTYLGRLVNDASGAYKGSIPIPPGIAPGSYTLQVNGFAPSGAIRSLSIGVIVRATRTTATRSTTVYFAPMSPVISDEGKARLRALARAVGGRAVRTVSIGYVQPTSQTGNDESLSTQRARNVAAFLKSLGVRGAYVVRGDGVAEQTGAKARRVNATVTYVR
jgi:outer membrane protein OmpA-like peptidoglycan-associated protein